MSVLVSKFVGFPKRTVQNILDKIKPRKFTNALFPRFSYFISIFSAVLSGRNREKC